LKLQVTYFFVPEKREKDVVEHLYAVYIQKALRWRDESKVDGMGWNPHEPRPHHCRFPIPDDDENRILITARIASS
jgi:hypothetical protein